jgi:hypothetical protein
MRVETAIYNLLRADSSVSALCPASRIKVPGPWQNLAMPYIIQRPVTIEPIRTHEGLAVLNVWGYYEVAIYASSYSQGRMLTDYVIAALDGQHPEIDIQLQGGTFHVGGQPDFDAEHFVVNFRVAEALSASPA